MNESIGNTQTCKELLKEILQEMETGECSRKYVLLIVTQKPGETTVSDMAGNIPREAGLGLLRFTLTAHAEHLARGKGPLN